MKFANTVEERSWHAEYISVHKPKVGTEYAFHPPVSASALPLDKSAVFETHFASGKYIGEDTKGNGSVFKSETDGKEVCFVILFGKSGSRITLAQEERIPAIRRVRVPLPNETPGEYPAVGKSRRYRYAGCKKK